MEMLYYFVKKKSVRLNRFSLMRYMGETNIERLIEKCHLHRCSIYNYSIEFSAISDIGKHIKIYFNVYIKID